MSFSEDPYKHIAVTYNHETGAFGFECNSCGYESLYQRQGRPARVYGARTAVTEIAADFWQHILKSHGLTREDTKDWS
jgi:hypothetical protein